MQLFNLLFIYLRTYLKTYIMGQILPGVVVAFENPKGGEVYADSFVCRLYSFAVKRRGGLIHCRGGYRRHAEHYRKIT